MGVRGKGTAFESRLPRSSTVETYAHVRSLQPRSFSLRSRALNSLSAAISAFIWAEAAWANSFSSFEFGVTMYWDAPR
jgi:hypothetical protein